MLSNGKNTFRNSTDSSSVFEKSGEASCLTKVYEAVKKLLGGGR